MEGKLNPEEVKDKSVEKVEVETIEDMREYVIEEVVGWTEEQIKDFDGAYAQFQRRRKKAEALVLTNPDTFRCLIENYDVSSGFNTSSIFPMVVNMVRSDAVEPGIFYVVQMANDDVVEIGVTDLTGSDSDGNHVKHVRGMPVVDDEGRRLAFKNPKAGSESIHVVRLGDNPDDWGQKAGHSELGDVYGWSVCGCGSARKSEENSLYLDSGEFDDDYIVRDGDIVGKLCRNCRRSLNGGDN